MIFSILICKKAPITRPERLSNLFIPPTPMPAIADPKFACMPRAARFARAACLGVVRLKPIGLLEAVISISSAKVPVYNPVHE